MCDLLAIAGNFSIKSGEELFSGRNGAHASMKVDIDPELDTVWNPS